MAGGQAEASEIAEYRKQLALAKEQIKILVDKLNCHPILVRLAWHDSGTFDQRLADFPARGGANGAIIHQPELTFGANAGLAKAVLYLKRIKKQCKLLSWADIIQLGSATAIECAGGPVIPMRYGRQDVAGPEDCVGSASREGFAGNAGLPDGYAPFGCGAPTPAEHLRNVFTKKMGFSDQEIVALSGAHTIGRAFAERSGACPFGHSNGKATKFTAGDHIARKDGKTGLGMEGGSSWTKNWLTFDNEYFKRPGTAEASGGDNADVDLHWLSTDAAVATDPQFRPTFLAYAHDQALFFRDYACAHAKLSELGAKWKYGKPIVLEAEADKRPACKRPVSSPSSDPPAAQQACLVRSKL